MKDTPKPSLVLTKTQRAFVEKLLTENENLIKYTISNALGEVYGYLLEECIGDLSLLVCEKVSVLEAHPNPKAWVAVSAKLTAFSAIKKNKNAVNGVPLERANVSKSDTTFEEALYSIWLQDGTIQKLIDTLTKRETQIYHKLYIENKDTETIATELGLTASTVRNIKKAIRDKILEQIKKKI